MTTLVSSFKAFQFSNPFAGFGTRLIVAFEKSAEQQAIRSLQHFSDSQLKDFGTSREELTKRIQNV